MEPVKERSHNLLRSRLEKAERTHTRRVLSPRTGLDFCSNDYLAFSEDEELRLRILEELKRPDLQLGSTGSRLIRGNSEIFEEVEAELARFCGREAALIYASGYQANVGLLSAIAQSGISGGSGGDLVFSDELNHASIIDGIRLSGARKKIYRHLDMADLRTLLIENQNDDALKIIVTESLFSMDGHHAPLEKIVQLAEEFSASVIVDEAHATGLWGRFDSGQAGGLVQEKRP